MRHAKMAELIKMRFGVDMWAKVTRYSKAHVCYLANIIERSMLNGNADFTA